MKKVLVLTLGALLTTGMAMALIGGSAHDFSADGWSNNEICLPCHTPHDGDMGFAGVPLWNHEVTTTVFTTYTGVDLQGTVGAVGGVSRLCLSCHDGSVALDSFGGATGSTTIGAGANLGTDLSNDHPISITYTAATATADGELHDPTTTASSLGGTIDVDMLYATRVECASCHDVHNTPNIASLLRISNNGSDLCLTCHNK